MCCGIVEDQDVVFIWVPFVKNIYCGGCMLENVLICKITLACLSSFEENLSSLCSIRGCKPSVISRYKVGNHQGSPFSFGAWNWILTFVSPMHNLAVIRIEGGLVMEPNNHYPTISECLIDNFL